MAQVRSTFTFRLIILALAAIPAASQEPTAPDTNSGWSVPSHMTVCTTSPDLPAVEILSFDRFSNGDEQIVSSYPNQLDRAESRVIVLDGRWMATKNVTTPSGIAIDALDGPKLTMQLVTRFLERAFPDGPSKVGKREALNVSEEFKPIRVNTVSAQGGWDAPWLLRGLLERNNANQITYDFIVQHSSPGDPEVHAIEFSGVWQDQAQNSSLPNTMSLRGWKVYTLGATKMAGNAAGVDFAAQEQPISYATVADLRATASSTNAGAKAPTRKISIPSSLTTSLQRY